MSVFNRAILVIMAIILLPIVLFSTPKNFTCDNLINSDSLWTEPKVLIETNLNQDRWISVDKGYHLIGSLISTTGISNSCMKFAEIKKDKSIYLGVGFTFTLGLSKELWDGQQNDNFFSWKDLTVNVLGILIGSILSQIE